MHQIVLITAMATTTGLFGGGKHCGGKVHHGRRAVSSCYSAAPCAATYAASPRGATYGAPYAAPYASTQAYPTSPQAVPMTPSVPAKATPSAPPVPAAPPVPTTSNAVPAPVYVTGATN